jgi:hypothetical protein
LLDVLEILVGQAPTDRLGRQILEEVIAWSWYNWSCHDLFVPLQLSVLYLVDAMYTNTSLKIMLHWTVTFSHWTFTDKENKKIWCSPERWTDALQHYTTWFSIRGKCCWVFPWGMLFLLVMVLSSHALPNILSS